MDVSVSLLFPLFHFETARPNHTKLFLFNKMDLLKTRPHSKYTRFPYLRSKFTTENKSAFNHFNFYFPFRFQFRFYLTKCRSRKNVTKFKRFHNKNLQFFISFEFVQYENYWIKVRATEGRDQWIESNRKKLSSTVAVSECTMMKPNIFFLTL